jgi:orotidine-5'-phosphate decarboxylase
MQTEYVVSATKAEYFTEIRKLFQIVSYWFLEWSTGRKFSEVCKYGMNANVGLLINSSEDYPSNGTDFAEKSRAEALKMQQEMEQLLV